jgi:hypothetical protein
MWNYLWGVKYEMENEKDLSDSEIESDLLTTYYNLNNNN